MPANNVYRIAITGPESTGKTTLAEQLAGHYQTICVPDYSRIYIDSLHTAYTETDVLNIAQEIITLEDSLLTQANKVMVSDNDLINIKIWLRYYNWNVPNWLEEAIVSRLPHLYLLCNIDLPWVADSQRANPHNRQQLFNSFQQELSQKEAHFNILTGNNLQRLNQAIEAVENCMKKNII